jgi:hypothetical protein
MVPLVVLTLLRPPARARKNRWVVLDDDEVSSDEDAPLQKRLQLSFATGGSGGSTPAVADVAAEMKATTDKEAVDKRATEEATVKVAVDKEVVDKRAMEEAAMKEAAVGATGDSSAPSLAPSSVAGSKRAAVPSGSTPPAKRPYRGVWKSRSV